MTIFISNNSSLIINESGSQPRSPLKNFRSVSEAEQLYTYPFLNWTKVTWPTPPSTEQQLPANKLGLMLG